MLGNFSYKNATKLYFGEDSLNITELGADKDMIKDIAREVEILSGGYKTLSKAEIEQILLESL